MFNSLFLKKLVFCCDLLTDNYLFNNVASGKKIFKKFSTSFIEPARSLISDVFKLLKPEKNI